jgi:Uma2 family endonuclease
MRLVFVRESDLDHMGGAMTTDVFTDLLEPMTEEEYFSLGETVPHIELFDGSLFVSPHATTRHQRISKRLTGILDEAAESADLEVLQEINLRLKPGRVCIPDLVVGTDFTDGLYLDASAVRLVCEITSPSNATNDRLVKMAYYAEAGIPWYLLIEQETAALHLYELAESSYVLRSLTGPGEVLNLGRPLVAAISPEDLLRRH